MVALVGASPVPLSGSGSPKEPQWLGCGAGDPLLPPIHVEVMTPKSTRLRVPLFKSRRDCLLPPLKKRGVGVFFGV